jgi:hypothetical protein
MVVELNESDLRNVLCNVIGDIEIVKCKLLNFRYLSKDDFVIKVKVKNNLNKNRFIYLIHYDKNNDYSHIYRVRKDESRYNPYKGLTTLHEYIQEKNCSKVY